MELRHSPVPNLGSGIGVGARAPVLQLTADGGLPAHHAEDNGGSSAGELGSCQPHHDHDLRVLPVYLLRVLGMYAAIMGPN